MYQYKVLICAEPITWGASLASAFSDNHKYTSLGCVSTGELIENALQLHPDVTIIKPGISDCLDYMEQLHHCCPFTVPVLLVEDPNDVDLHSWLMAGARGCLPLRLLPIQIVEAVTLMLEAGILCLPRFKPEQLSIGDSQSMMNTLTGRERQIALLLKRNMSNLEIAESLCLSESTIKTHLRNIFRKLEVRNRNEAQSVIIASAQIQSIL